MALSRAVKFSSSSIVGLVVTAASLCGGCASPNKVEFVASGATAPRELDRLEVWLALPTNGGDYGIFYGFKKTMPGELAACSVQATVLSGVPDKNEDPSSRAVEMRLVLVTRDAAVDKVTTVDQFNNVLSENEFQQLEAGLAVKLLDYKTERVTWSGFVRLHMEKPGPDTGEELARAVVARLRTDGVLRHCRQ